METDTQPLFFGGSGSKSGFHDLGIAPQILKTLDYFGFTEPTPIQHQAIPLCATGVDVIGIAQTGTGKTLAFGVPTVQHIMLQGGKALIVVPTRELAIQVEESILGIARPLHLTTVVLIGGEPIYRQIRKLKQDPDIIIATPGRLNDHLKQGTVALNTVRIVILDEADRMLDMGFAPQIDEIMKHVPENRQTLLFSATMPDEITRLVDKYQKEPQRIEIARAGSKAEHVTHELIILNRADKLGMLKQLLEEYSGPILIFTRTKHGAKNLTEQLRRAGVTAMEIHSNRSLIQRKQAMEGFKSGRANVLVATDIAARGIDVAGISLVCNYDIPDNPEDYVHRIGRTGRAGSAGHAATFVTPDQAKEVRNVERVLGERLPLSPRSQLTLTQELTFRSKGSRQTTGARPHGAQRAVPFRDRRTTDGRSDHSRNKPRQSDRHHQDRSSDTNRNTSSDRSRERSDSTFEYSVSTPKGFTAPRSSRKKFRRR